MARAKNSSKRNGREESRTRVGYRWSVFGDGQRSIRINCWIGGGCAGAEYRNASRTLPR